MSGNEEPRVLGFLCNWCAYAGADLAGVSRLQLPANFCVIRTMCSARTEPLFLFKALLGGMDGVLVAGCHPGDCHYQRGNYFTRRRLVMVQEILKALNMEHERVRLQRCIGHDGMEALAGAELLGEEHLRPADLA